MAYLNANIPVQYAQIKKEYLYDLKKHQGEVEDCIIFGMVRSLTGQGYLIPCHHGPNGAVFYRLPISAASYSTKNLNREAKFHGYAKT